MHKYHLFLPVNLNSLYSKTFLYFLVSSFSSSPLAMFFSSLSFFLSTASCCLVLPHSPLPPMSYSSLSYLSSSIGHAHCPPCVANYPHFAPLPAFPFPIPYFPSPPPPSLYLILSPISTVFWRSGACPARHAGR